MKNMKLEDKEIKNMRKMELKKQSELEVNEDKIENIGFCVHKQGRCCIKFKHMENKDNRKLGDMDCETHKGYNENSGWHGGHHKHMHHSHKGNHKHHFHLDRNGLQGKLRGCGKYLAHKGGHGGSQDNVLNIIFHKGEITQKELQNILNIKGGSLSELVSKLVCKELVLREKSKEDNRVYVLKLTEKGEKIANTIIKQKQEDENDEKVFKSLSIEQKEQLDLILDILLDDWYGEKEHNE